MIMVAIALVSTVDFQVCHDVDSRALICCDLSWTSLLLAFVAWLRLRVIWIFSGTLDKLPYLFISELYSTCQNTLIGSFLGFFAISYRVLPNFRTC